jgi:hypothetical protein
MNDGLSNSAFFAGLKALADSAFPKQCKNCGKMFVTANQFIAETKAIRQGMTGLKQGVDDDDVPVVEVYRNCTCGSTLMDFFSDRRNVTEEGKKRRALFNQLMSHLQKKGISYTDGRACLLRLLHGNASDADRELFKDASHGDL